MKIPTSNDSELNLSTSVIRCRELSLIALGLEVNYQVTWTFFHRWLLPKRCASRYLQNPNRQIRTVRFHFHGAGRLNQGRRREYQKLHLNRHVPLQSIQGANRGDPLPKELAMMDHPALPLSKVRNLVDLSYALDRHLQLVADHLIFDLKVLDKKRASEHLNKHRHYLAHRHGPGKLEAPSIQSSARYVR